MLKTLLHNNIHSSLNVKLLIYTSLLTPIWLYGIQLWGNAKKSSLNKIQTFQNIALRKLSNAPPYVLNLSLHADLNLKTFNEEAKAYYQRFHARTNYHKNPLIKNLASFTIPGNPPRRLKRKWFRDLLNN